MLLYDIKVKSGVNTGTPAAFLLWAEIEWYIYYTNSFKRASNFLIS